MDPCVHLLQLSSVGQDQLDQQLVEFHTERVLQPENTKPASCALDGATENSFGYAGSGHATSESQVEHLPQRRVCQEVAPRAADAGSPRARVHRQHRRDVQNRHSQRLMGRAGRVREIGSRRHVTATPRSGRRYAGRRGSKLRSAGTAYLSAGIRGFVRRKIGVDWHAVRGKLTASSATRPWTRQT